MKSRVRRSESAAANGARWITAAFVVVGLLNYGYALLMTRLLTIAGYSKFAAGQGLILWASTVAVVSVPWVLAQALARARTDEERHSAVRFAKLVSVGCGILGAALVGLTAALFAGAVAAFALAISTFVIFLGTTTTGFLQGQERMRGLAALYVVENVLKNGAGVLLVLVWRLGDAGALAAFGIGGLVMLARWPRTPRQRGRAWGAVIRDKALWRRAIQIAGAQSLVSLFAAVDVVLVAMLPGHQILAASYQVSATLARVPLFIASAVATAYFPSLSRRKGAALLAAQAMRLYAAISLPMAAILVTVPATALAFAFPSQFSAVAALLKYTAMIGLAIGGISLITGFFQAADDYSCVGWLGVGVAGYVGALLAGWLLDGVPGMAAGGALGAVSALFLLTLRLVRKEGHRVLNQIPVLEPLAAAGILFVLRPYPVLWLPVAGLVGLRAVRRFLRPGARHAAGARWTSLRRRRSAAQPVTSAPAQRGDDATRRWPPDHRDAAVSDGRKALTL